MTNTIIINDKTWTLDRGAHVRSAGKVCLLEIASLKAGERLHDHPEAVSPVLAAFGRALWDTTPEDDLLADLLPFADRLIGTADRPDLDQQAGLMAADWSIRRFPVPWLQLAGLDAHADALESLPELTSWDLVEQARATIIAAKDAAWGARNSIAWNAAEVASCAAARTAAQAASCAARMATWRAGRNGAWAAVRAAGKDVAEAAAQAAAQAAAEDAAWASAWASGRAALAPASTKLRAEAINLFDRMIRLWEN